MTQFTYEYRGDIYEITASCGKVTSIYKFVDGRKVGEPLEWAELPFLVQAGIESRLNSTFADVPPDLYS